MTKRCVVGDPQLFIILYVSWAPTQSTATKSLPAHRFNWQVPICNVEFPISKLRVGWVSWSFRCPMGAQLGEKHRRIPPSSQLTGPTHLSALTPNGWTAQQNKTSLSVAKNLVINQSCRLKIGPGWYTSFIDSMTQLAWGSNAFPSENQGETLLQLGWVFFWRWHGLNWPDRGDLEHATYCLFLNQYCTNNLPYIHETQDESQPPQQRQQQQQCWEIEHDWTEGLW